MWIERSSKSFKWFLQSLYSLPPVLQGVFVDLALDSVLYVDFKPIKVVGDSFFLLRHRIAFVFGLHYRACFVIGCAYCLTFSPEEFLLDLLSLLIVLLLSVLSFLLLVSIILVKLIVILLIFRLLLALVIMLLRFAFHHSIILWELLQDLGVASSLPHCVDFLENVDVFVEFICVFSGTDGQRCHSCFKRRSWA